MQKSISILPELPEGGEKQFYLSGFRSEYLIRTIDLTLSLGPAIL